MFGFLFPFSKIFAKIFDSERLVRVFKYHPLCIFKYHNLQNPYHPNVLIACSVRLGGGVKGVIFKTEETTYQAIWL